MPLPRILRDLLNLPTAAFAEHAVLDYIRDACAKLAGVSCTTDRYGNLLARYRRNPPRGVTPLAFSAHTDHPGFVARKMRDARTLHADFRGGVFAEYFPGARVRFFSGGEWVFGKVLEVTRPRETKRSDGAKRRPQEVTVRVTRAVEPGSPGMWDLTDAALKGDIVHARGCDDVAGAAALLALLERLSRKQAAAETYCLFTRAEEVGFIGAIAACKARTLPRRVPIIAIETSSARGGGAEIGAGPVLRVGDKASVFTPGLTNYCGRVAERLAKRRKSFQYQRKLMAGGTCESTAYIVYGYQATGICLALGNYHNMDVDRGKISAETISLRDWKQMVDWFEALALDRPGYTRSAEPLRDELEKRFHRWAPLFDAPAPRG
ncbi:MAG: hypothetical protein D6744_09705 [Planctomycetota bacterium]|nr:MAG: hypothetical protein D6744_09705 [Planctomycetota bacterium]